MSTDDSPTRRALLWLAVVLAAAVTGAGLQPAHGLAGAYFANPRWEGRAHVVRIDPTVTTAVLQRPPAAAWQAYSVEWTGALLVLRPGEYTLAARSDDGSEVIVDGATVVDSRGGQQTPLVAARRHLGFGVHPIQVRYAQLGGRYACDLLWAYEDAGLVPIPMSALLPEAPSVATAVALHLWPWLAAAVLLAAGRRVIAWLPRPRPRDGRAHGARAFGLGGLDDPATALVVIWALGGALRLAAMAWGRPVLWPDSYVFHVTASDILRGYLTSHDAYRTLAYPFLMAAFLRVGDSLPVWSALVALQHLLGLVSASLVYLLGRRVLPPRVALGGALAFALHGVTVFYEASILTETLFTFALMVVLWTAMRLAASPSLGRALIAGVACGLLVLVRPVAQWYAVAVVLALVVSTAPRRPRAAAGLAIVVALVVTTWPMRVINQREFGFSGIALGSGLGMYTRVFEVDAYAPPERSADGDVRDLWAASQALGWHATRVRDTLDFDHGLTSAQADQRLLAFALETMAAHPLEFAVSTAWQWVVQLADPELGASWCGAGRGSYPCSGPDPERRAPFRLGTIASSRLQPYVTAYLVRAVWPMWPLLALALAGAWTFLRRAWAHPIRAEALLLVATGVYFTLVPAVSQWPQDRYRLPVDAIWFMLALYGAGVTAPAGREPADGNVQA